MPFKADEVNWDELSGIGIMKDELELSGEMDTRLRGEKTKVMSLSLVLLGGPSKASTTSSTESTMDITRSTSPPKSACPGVSTMLIR